MITAVVIVLVLANLCAWSGWGLHVMLWREIELQALRQEAEQWRRLAETYRRHMDYLESAEGGENGTEKRSPNARQGMLDTLEGG